MEYEYVRYLNINLFKNICILLKYYYVYFEVKILYYVDVEVKFLFIVY